MPYYPTPREPRQQCTCLHCGKSFTETMAKLRQGGGKYCHPRCSRAARIRPPEERFWEKVDKSGACWLWTGALMKRGGYGAFTLARNARTVRAHRYAWELLRGPIPAGMMLCHNCPGGDNPRCVNPDHMFIGTQAENLRDMWRKGRGRYPTLQHIGADHHNAKRNAEKVRVMRVGLAAGVEMTVLARSCGVDPATIANSKHGRIRKHVT